MQKEKSAERLELQLRDQLTQQEQNIQRREDEVNRY